MSNECFAAGGCLAETLRARIAELERLLADAVDAPRDLHLRIAELEAVNGNEIRLCHEHIADLKQQIEQLDRYIDDLRGQLAERNEGVWFNGKRYGRTATADEMSDALRALDTRANPSSHE